MTTKWILAATVWADQTCIWSQSDQATSSNWNVRRYLKKLIRKETAEHTFTSVKTALLLTVFPLALVLRNLYYKCLGGGWFIYKGKLSEPRTKDGAWLSFYCYQYYCLL